MGSIGVHRRETKGDIGENERSEFSIESMSVVGCRELKLSCNFF